MTAAPEISQAIVLGTSQYGYFYGLSGFFLKESIG